MLQTMRSSLRTAFSTTARRGFTLIEIAIVLVVIGLIVSGGLFAVSPLLLSAKINETKQKMATVEAALQGYVIAYGCLPCPALTGASATGQARYGSTNYVANCATTACAGTPSGKGLVPWVTLGISQNDVIDGWGRRFTYAVSPNMTTDDSVERDSGGAFPTVTSSITMQSSTGTVSLGYTGIAYVIVSHGLDGSLGETSSGSTMADKYGQSGDNVGQDENADADLTFATGDVNASNNDTYFDDIVSFRSLQPLIISCGAGSCGNPS